MLCVEDDPAMGALLVKELGRRGFGVRHVRSANDALAAVEVEDYDAVVSDVRLGGMTGLELCERLVARRPELPVILITAFGDLDTAIAAIRAGAHDFLPKPFELEELAIRVTRAAELRALRAEVRRLREGIVTPAGIEEMIGEHATMQRVVAMIQRVASSEAPVLIAGETGTGKELVARALHARSPRAAGPFVAVNCAALPEALLESELFGHTKGAFTDARAPRAGLFVEASGGTLFLDEIAEMPLALQAKLLRALQEHTVRPVGSDREVAFDARIVSATHRDLESRVADGEFRDDLYYRLNVLQVRLPALRERGSDVLLIANHALKRIAQRSGKPVRGIAPEAARKLLAYDWPGNVRELMNAMERAVALAEYDDVTVADLPEKIQAFTRSHVLVAADDPNELLPLDEIERRYILRVIEAVGGNRTRAAEILKVDRKTLYTKLKSYGWRPSDPPLGAPPT
ncbi:Response regulator of zinc sigma-54-dependent two-component system [Sandaracinus amylolyticus]|uniref:Response regulator of zinc sigma-54-dependent two-component system n=1 Tax=Sandaracinus amylolyticus TaxID=927083 RepID=A0A0F6YGK1_9BACT|nr:Response regulator of zinc sigma-54-dependent two-component system [Sandaracinus amylolyticus]